MGPKRALSLLAGATIVYLVNYARDGNLWRNEGIAEAFRRVLDEFKPGGRCCLTITALLSRMRA